MKAEVKVIHSSEVRVAKSGKKYRKVTTITTIEGIEFMDTRYIFEN